SPEHYKDTETMAQPYTVNDVSLNVPEFTPLQEQQLYKSASQGIPKSKIPDLRATRQDRMTGYMFTPFQEKFAPIQVKSIADNYSNNLTKSALVHYENLMHDPNAYSAATKAYQQVYGADQLIDTPQKMAKAVAATHAMSEVKTGEDKVVDWQLRQRIANQNSLNRLYVYADIQGKNPAVIEQHIDQLIGQHIAQGRQNNGEVLVDNTTWEALTGTKQMKSSVLKIDENGNYEYGKRNSETGAIENLKPVPFELAKTKLTQ